MAVQVCSGDPSLVPSSYGEVPVPQPCTLPMASLPNDSELVRSVGEFSTEWNTKIQDQNQLQLNGSDIQGDNQPTFSLSNAATVDSSETALRYPCTKCSKAFKRGDHLKRHLVKVHDEDHPYLCGDCSKGFPTIDSLVEHNQTSHFGIVTKGPYCAWCKLTFECIEDIEMHANTIHKKQDAEYMDFINKTCKVFGCIFCHKTVATEKNLIRHLEKMHSFSKCENGIYCCVACDVTFQTASKLEKHNEDLHRNHEAKKVAVKKSKPKPPDIPRNFKQKKPSKNNQLSNQFSYPVQNGLPSVCLAVTTNSTVLPKSSTVLANSENSPFAQKLLDSLRRSKPELPTIEPYTVSAALSSALQALSEFSYDELSCHDYDYVPSGFSVFRSSPLIPYFHYPQNVQCSNVEDGAVDSTLINEAGVSCTTSSVSNQTSSAFAESSNATHYPQNIDLVEKPAGIYAANTNQCVDESQFIAKRGRPKKRKESEFDFQSMFIKKVEDKARSVYSCTRCNKIFKNVNHVMAHIETVHLKLNPYECCICKKRFAQAGNVKRHIRFVHLRERPFQCNDCNSTFDRLCYLQRHMRSHVEVADTDSVDKSNPNFCNCPECGKRCLTIDHLRGHLQRKHYPKSKNGSDAMAVKYGHVFNGIERSEIHAQSEQISPESKSKTVAKSKKPATTHLEEMFDQENPILQEKTIYGHRRIGPLSPRKKNVNVSVTLTRKRLRKSRNILPFKCYSCVNHRFASLGYLKSHVTIFHHSTLRRHLCFKCGRNYSAKSFLIGHTLKRHGKRFLVPKLRKNSR